MTPKDPMRRLVIDIETSPMRGRHWGLWQQNIALSQLEDPTQMITFAAKWYGERKVHYYAVWEHGKRAMVKAVRDLLDEAEVVIHFNGERFDRRHINREIQEMRTQDRIDGSDGAEFLPPSPYQQIDVLKTVKSQFYLPSNKLEYVLRWLGREGKVSHQGFGLWVAVENGDEKARKLMKRYNIGDITKLEDVYNDLQVWVTGHPNMQLFMEPDGEDKYGKPTVDESACPLCGSYNSHKEGTAPRGNLSRVQRYQCNDCGKFFNGQRAVRIARGR